MDTMVLAAMAAQLRDAEVAFNKTKIDKARAEKNAWAEYPFDDEGFKLADSKKVAVRQAIAEQRGNQYDAEAEKNFLERMFNIYYYAHKNDVPVNQEELDDVRDLLELHRRTKEEAKQRLEKEKAQEAHKESE